MQNFADYVRWRGDLTVETSPLCEVDFALFAQLVYAKFEKLELADHETYAMADLYNRYVQVLDEKTLTQRHKDLLELWKLMVESPRFAQLFVVNFRSYFEEGDEGSGDRQFAAATFVLPGAEGQEVIVTFRGTDSTVVGWREDLAMSYENMIPAQGDAVVYLTEACGLFGRVHVCGHSKGGNLALYSAVQAEQPELIADVWNFDGPGLTDPMLATPAWEALQDRVTNFVPEGSIIGMIRGRNMVREDVVADGNNAQQHSLFLWHVLGKAFVRAEKRTRSGEAMANGIQLWLDTTTWEDRQAFADAVFKVAEESGAQYVDGLIKETAKTLASNLVRRNDTYTEEEFAALKYFMVCLGKGGVGEITGLLPEFSLPEFSLENLPLPRRRSAEGEEGASEAVAEEAPSLPAAIETASTSATPEE